LRVFWRMHSSEKKVRKRMSNNKIKPELESCAVFEGSKPTNAIRLQSTVANLSNPVNFGIIQKSRVIDLTIEALMQSWFVNQTVATLRFERKLCIENNLLHYWCFSFYIWIYPYSGCSH